MFCGSHPVCIRGGLLARFSSIDFTKNVGRVGFVSTAIALMYPEFKSDVVQSGIDDQARSEGIWRHCDIDRSNMFDFKEFSTCSTGTYGNTPWTFRAQIHRSQTLPRGGYGQDYIKANKMQLYSALKGQAFCNPASSPRSVCP